MPFDVYVIVTALAINGLILFIINGAFRESSLKKKGIALLITSLILIVIYAFAFVFDYINKTLTYPIQYYIYFIGASVLYLLAFAIPPLYKGIKYGYGEVRKEKMVYTYHKKEEHIYLIYKYNTYVYLTKDNLSGIDYQMKSNEFTDDVLSKINNKYNASIKFDIERSGMITVKGEKIDKIYYCYLIELDQELDDDNFELKNVYEIPDLLIPEFDKYLLLNSLMGEYFEKNYIDKKL